MSSAAVFGRRMRSQGNEIAKRKQTVVLSFVAAVLTHVVFWALLPMLLQHNVSLGGDVSVHRIGLAFVPPETLEDLASVKPDKKKM